MNIGCMWKVGLVGFGALLFASIVSAAQISGRVVGVADGDTLTLLVDNHD
jgi:endonuclease YncB( thermonuclease family)